MYSKFCLALVALVAIVPLSEADDVLACTTDAQCAPNPSAKTCCKKSGSGNGACTTFDQCCGDGTAGTCSAGEICCRDIICLPESDCRDGQLCTSSSGQGNFFCLVKVDIELNILNQVGVCPSAGAVCFRSQQ